MPVPHYIIRYGTGIFHLRGKVSKVVTALPGRVMVEAVETGGLADDYLRRGGVPEGEFAGSG